MNELTYDRIARDYHLKRRKPWKPLINFMDVLHHEGIFFNGICLDLGCANGRHFKLFKNARNRIVGIDNSLEFLKIIKNDLRHGSQFNKEEMNEIQVIMCDMINLPIRRNTINNTVAIATIHHVSSKTARKDVMQQIVDILKEDGYFLLTVWRKWQKKYRNAFFLDWIRRKSSCKFKKSQIKLGLKESGDKYVKWTVSSENSSYNRFYHFFSKREIKKMLELYKIKSLQIKGGPGNKDNFFVLVQKQ